MSLIKVNCGGLQDRWLRVPDEEAGVEFVGTFEEALRRAHQITQQQERLVSGTLVFAPEPRTHELLPAIVDDEASGGRRHRAGCRTISWVGCASGSTTDVAAEGRLVQLEGYPERLLSGCAPSRAEDGNAVGGPVAIWRAEIWCEGLFSMLFWALGYLEHAAQSMPGGRASEPAAHPATGIDGASPSQHPCFLIDWTDERILFHRSSTWRRSPVNAWNSFFEQPGRAACAADVVPARGGLVAQREGSVAAECAAGADEAGRLMPAPFLASLLRRRWDTSQAGRCVSISCGFGEPAFSKLGRFKGADEGSSDADEQSGDRTAPTGNQPHCGLGSVGAKQLYRGGRLDQTSADAGRDAVRQWIRVRPRVRRRVEQTARLLGLTEPSEWLAVHVRRTDKLQQCAANDVPEEALVRHISGFCAGLGCSGVLLCSDDGPLKCRLAGAIQSLGLRAAQVEVPLSLSALPAHLDPALDARANAEDVLVEVLLMAERCRSLLSTWSNVSTAAVFFSPPGYSHAMFGDAPPLPSPRRPPARLGLANRQASERVDIRTHSRGQRCISRAWAIGGWCSRRRGCARP